MDSPVVLFDDGLASLSPLTDLRASFEVRTGALTLRERMSLVLGGAPALAPTAALRGVVAERHGAAVGAAQSGAIALNGRCVIPPTDLLDLEPETALVDAQGDVIAARTNDPWKQNDPRKPGAGVRRIERPETMMLRAPWDVIRHRDAVLAFDLELLGRHAETSALPAHVHAIAPERVWVDPSARLFPGVVLDAEGGAIVIAEDVVVRPHAAITGPASIGPGSVVQEGGVIRAHTCVGPVCKVGGEVSGALFQGYANKAHDGFIGDTWIGEWANLGAGTITSNLRNTYGEIRSRRAPVLEREATGLTFFGAIIGDHVKTAIGTRLMTGSVLGTGAMVALSAHAPTCAGAFAWLTDGGEETYGFDRFLDVARRVMARRGVELSETTAARLRAVHAGPG